MIILLPPSETKTRPAEDSPPLDLAELSVPELTAARRTVLAAAARTARGRTAAADLKVPASQGELVERMAHLEDEPAAPALEVYSGVLYDALGTARPQDGRRMLVTSALLGIVDAATDRIPAYRLSAASRLSRLGAAGSWWRGHLTALGQRLGEGQLVLDCRSGGYRSMMRVPGALEVGAVRETAGQRTVISHDAKRYRGLVARTLLESDEAPASPEQAREIVARAFASPESMGVRPGLDVELSGSALTVIDRG